MTTTVTEAAGSRRTALLRGARTDRPVLIGSALLIGVAVLGLVSVEGFVSVDNLRSMLLLAAFLGIASVGQTLCALVGGLDLSIPSVIGASNIGCLWLITKGFTPVLAALTIVLMGLLIGAINGLLSLRLQGQALVVTLGTGFVVVGGTQIITSLGSQYGGNVSGTVPGWLSNMSSLSGTTFGIPLPPIVPLWLLLVVALTFVMRGTVFGRSLYLLGGNRIAARLAQVSEARTWIGVYALSGFFSALCGVVLLGFTGGGFVGVGDPYLFLTVAAVAVGGTSLLGGDGGYGRTVLGVLVLTLLTSLLVGWGLDNNAQQVVLGLLIIPLVAIYARGRHVRYSV